MDFNKKLSNLKDRRILSKSDIYSNLSSSSPHNITSRSPHDITSRYDHGITSSSDYSIESMSPEAMREKYEDIQENSAIRFVIGAMSPVPPKSTQISIEEGERVAKQVIDRLEKDGIIVTSKLQGSVALDIHIKGHSDVDMLIIEANTFTFEEPKIDQSIVPSSDPRDMKDKLKEIREKSEEALTEAYQAAEVNCDGAKSIALSGGSLQRKVDIVPSCWHRNLEFQRTQLPHELGVHIYDKYEHKLIGNKPFLHIHRVEVRDQKYNGNLKRVVRLIKNLVADMDDAERKIAKELSSYDLTSIAYHMDSHLNVPTYKSLELVERLRSFLGVLSMNNYYRLDLNVPDDSRKIFNDPKKEKALEVIRAEVTDLAHSIYHTLAPLRGTLYNPELLINKSVEID